MKYNIFIFQETMKMNKNKNQEVKIIDKICRKVQCIYCTFDVQ